MLCKLKPVKVADRYLSMKSKLKPVTQWFALRCVAISNCIAT